MASIKISPKHGVNPSIPACFFCGRDKNEIVLFGRLKGDAEAPRHPVVDMEPCGECKADMARGYALLGTAAMPVLDGQPAAGKDDQGRPVYLTGAYAVLSEGDVRRVFQEPAAGAILKAGRAYVPHELVLRLCTEQERPRAGTDTDAKEG